MSSDSELRPFFESSTDEEDVDVVYSQYTPYRIAISQSCPQHHVMWMCYRIAIFFFKRGSNFGIVSLKF